MCSALHFYRQAQLPEEDISACTSRDNRRSRSCNLIVWPRSASLFETVSCVQTVATASLVGLEPDQIPQLWLYLLNSTALSAGGTTLTTTGGLP